MHPGETLWDFGVFFTFSVPLSVFICKALNHEESVVLTYEVVCVGLTASVPVSSREESESGCGHSIDAAPQLGVKGLCRQD